MHLVKYEEPEIVGQISSYKLSLIDHESVFYSRKNQTMTSVWFHGVLTMKDSRILLVDTDIYSDDDGEDILTVRIGAVPVDQVSFSEEEIEDLTEHLKISLSPDYYYDQVKILEGKKSRNL